MNILILSSNNGQGHNSSAKALKEYFEKKGMHCDIYDSLELISKIASRAVSCFHSISYKKLSYVYNASYDRIKQNKKFFEVGSLYRRILDCAVEKLSQYLVDNNIDCVISTHIFGSIISSDAIAKWNLNIKNCFVSTDYCCTPGLEELRNTIIFIPDKCLKSSFVSSIDSSCQIITTGIPISESFKFKKHNNSNSMHTLFLIGISNKKINNDLLFRLCALCNEANQIHIICNHKGLFNKLRKYSNDYLKVFRWCPNIADELLWADVFITKPGGLAVTEAISAKTPLMLYKVINAYEEDNCEYVLKNNFGMTFNKYIELFDKWVEIVNDKALLDGYNKSLKSHEENNACEIIFNFISAICKEGNK